MIKFEFYELSDSGFKQVEKGSIFERIRDFIEENFQENESYEESQSSEKSQGSDKTVFIVFVRMKDLHEPKIYELLKDTTSGGNTSEGAASEATKSGGTESEHNASKDTKSEKITSSLNRRIYDKICGKDEGKPYIISPSPMIVVGLEDITGMYRRKDKTGANQANDTSNKEIINQLNLDNRALFFDTSIWNRYVPLDEHFEERFKNVLTEICAYHEMGLYQTVVAVEYLEFRTRMMLNSYLAPLQSGHARNISPFHFHSETYMREMARREFEKIKDAGICWHCLLVDDYASKPLRKIEAKKEKSEGEKTSEKVPDECEEKGKNKKQILEQVLKTFDETLGKEKIKTIEIQGEKPEGVVDDTINKLKNDMYDIIFLDYLLGKSGAGGDKRETCIELLKRIRDHGESEDKDKNKDLLENKGPLGKFWFFPISAFSYAMLDDMREQGFGHHTDLWEISSGADPINTPNLFLYKLLKFMNQQIKEIGIPQISESESSRTGFLTFFNETFCTAECVRTAAQSSYPIFVTIHTNYEMLRNESEKRKKRRKRNEASAEKEKPECFTSSVLKTYFHDLDASFFEHLDHLIYLLAYGSNVQKAEMWEEYNFVKKCILRKVRRGESERGLKNIEDFILKL